MIKNIHHKLFHSSTPFAYATVAAFVIGLGDLFATSADLIWLWGDASRDYHTYHGLVAIGLVIADLIMIASFIWLYRAIHKYLAKKESKELKTCHRIKAVEDKLSALEHYFEFIEIDDEQLCTQAGLVYLPDENLITLLKAFRHANRGVS
jgi:hypothetical protein